MSALLERYAGIPRRKKVLFFAMVSGLLLYLEYSEKVQPAIEQLEFAQAQARDLEARIAALQQSTQKMSSLSEEKRRAEDEIAGLKAVLPEEPEIDVLLATLSGAARSSGSEIVSFTPKKAETEKQQPRQPSLPQSVNQGTPGSPGTAENRKQEAEALGYKTDINMVLRGSFGELVSFFDKALNIERMLHLKSLSLKVLDQEASNFSGSRLLMADAIFVAFSQRPSTLPSEAGGPDKDDDPYGVRAREERLRDRDLSQLGAPQTPVSPPLGRSRERL